VSPINLSGVFLPQVAHISFEGIVFNYWPVAVQVFEISKFAGSAVGSAVVGYPSHFAEDASPDMGKWVKLKIGSKLVFRGVVGHAPFRISPTEDDMQLVCFDDKWGMESTIVGQIGRGTQPTTPADEVGDSGFKDVGFEVVFNAEGKPNKNASSYDFDTGSSAAYWTLQDIIVFLFTYYISTDVATVSTGSLSVDPADLAYLRTPSHLDLTGQTALQAVDNVAQLAGESWGLTPGVSASAFTRVRPGAGTNRKVYLVAPKTGVQSTSTNTFHASTCVAGNSIRNSRDTYQAVSGPIVKETTYTNTGVDPLLVRLSTYKDKEYVARFQVDVSKYTANSLGLNLSAGSTPKEWSPSLVTRKKTDGSGYVTAAEIVTTPSLARNETILKPVLWISPANTTESNALLCTGGYRIDEDKGTIDFKSEIEVMPATGTKARKGTVPNWASVGIWFTVATILRTPESKQSADGNTYLPRAFYELISKPDLSPDRREDSYLPNLATSNNNDITKVAVGAEEKYVDIGAKLTDAIDSALAANAAIETPLTIEFPFIPIFDLGDRIDIRGRGLGETGNEVVTSITYTFTSGVPSLSKVKATNVAIAVEPDDFIEGQ